MVFWDGLINGDIYIYPRCHGNEIWDKIGYNSACVRDFCEIVVPLRDFRGWAIECCQLVKLTLVKLIVLSCLLFYGAHFGQFGQIGNRWASRPNMTNKIKWRRL